MATFHLKMQCLKCAKMHMVSFSIQNGRLRGVMGRHTWRTFDDNTSQEITLPCEGSGEVIHSSALSNANFQKAWKHLGGK